MGRTWRKRRRRKPHIHQPANYQELTINLQKLIKSKFKNSLKLHDFPETGRGVLSLKTIKANDILIQIPYSANSKLTMHDLLTIFLIMERHKGPKSEWKIYMESLPPETPWLPLLLSQQQIELLPADLRLVTEKTRGLQQESWSRLKKSIRPEWKCECCSKTADCVLNYNIFTWGYVLVNTRAVYVDPAIVIRTLSDVILSDEPSMALCPFVDMLNHSYSARTEAQLIPINANQWVFQLTTLTEFKKFQQVFISYGAHDNLKLITEYGFYIPGNCHDSIHFKSCEIYTALKVNLSDFQYKFLRKHSLDSELYIDRITGPSFNLKAFLFIISNSKHQEYSTVIYNDSYSDESRAKIDISCSKLLEFKLQLLESEINAIPQDFPDIIVNFLRYRREFLESLVKKDLQL